MSDVEVRGRIGPDGPALLVLYTGGTFGMGQDADGSLVPLDLSEIRDHLPFLRRLPLALTVATFRDPIDSSAMGTSDWLDIADAIVDPCAGTCRSGGAPRHRHDGLHSVRAQLPARGDRHPDRADRCAAAGHRAALGWPREPGDRPGDRCRAPARRSARARSDDLLLRPPSPRQPSGESARRQLSRFRVAEPPAAGDRRRLDRVRVDLDPGPELPARSGAAEA